MGTESKFVFDLIKRLDKNEKGYIRKMAQAHSTQKKSRNLQLFDAFSKADECDENQLMKKLGYGNKKNQFAVARNYLSNFILQCLEGYYRNPHSEIRSMVNQAEILLNKGFYAGAEKLFSRAEAMANKYECSEMLIPIYNRQLAMISESSPGRPWLPALENKHAEATRMLESISTELKRRIDFFRAIHCYDFGGKPESGNSAMAKPGSRETFISQYYSLVRQDVHFILLGRKSEALRVVFEILDLWQRHPDMKKMYANNYFGTLNNIISHHLSIHEFPKIRGWLDTQFEMIYSGKVSELKYVIQHYLLSTDYACKTKNFEYGKKTQAYFDQYFREMPTGFHSLKNSFMQAYAKVLWYLGCGMWKEAYSALLRIHGIPRTNYNPFLYHELNIIEIILLYRLEKTEILDSRVLNLRRILRRKNKLDSAEKAIFAFVSGTMDRNTFLQEAKNWRKPGPLCSDWAVLLTK